MRTSKTGRSGIKEIEKRKRRIENAGRNIKKISGISGRKRCREKIDYVNANITEKYPVSLICRTIGIKRSSYYNRKSNPETQKEAEQKLLLKETKRLFEENYCEYGRIRMKKALNDNGYNVSEGTARKLLRMNKLWSKRCSKYKATTNSKHKYQVADNILNREFKADKPNQKWCGDSTYIWTDEGWLYAAALVDLCDKSCVGLSFSNKHTQELMITVLENAVKEHRPPKGLLHHSDRGAQYASTAYKTKLKEYGMIQSMSLSGVPYDNAPMESFWSTVKTACVLGQHFKTRKQAESVIFKYVFGFYNTHRYHSSIGYEIPKNYREKMLSVA